MIKKEPSVTNKKNLIISFLFYFIELEKQDELGVSHVPYHIFKYK